MSGRIWRDEDLCEHPTAYNMDGRGTSWHSDDIIEVSDSSRYPIFEGLLEIHCDDVEVFYASNTRYESYGGKEAVYFKLLANPPPDPAKHTRALEIIQNSGFDLPTFYSLEGAYITWTDANTQVSPITTNMDGSGTHLSDGDTINLATKSIEFNESHTPATTTVTAGTLLVDAGITFTAGGTISVYNLDLSTTGCSFDTTTSNYSLTVTHSCGVTGTLTCNGSTVNIGSGLDTETSAALYIFENGTFAGGSATHTYGSMGTFGTGCTVTLTSGTTTINGRITSHEAFWTDAGMTYSHANGTVVFTYAGEQLLADFSNTARTTFYNMTINHSSCSVLYSSGAYYNLTVANNLTISVGSFNTWDGTTSSNLTTQNGCTVAGTLGLHASTVSCTGTGTADGYSINSNGTFNGGSGTHTFGSIEIQNNNWTWTSGTATINSVGTTYNIAILSYNSSWTHNSGTVTFTRAGTQYLHNNGNYALSLYNVTINNSSCAISYYSTKYFNLTVANNLTITAGSFDTWDGTTSANLTTQNACAVSGTLSLHASTVSCTGRGTTNSSSIRINNGGTLNGGSSTCTFGSMYNPAGSHTINFSSGTTTFNNATSDSGGLTLVDSAGANIVHNNGTIAFTYAGAQGLYFASAHTCTLYNVTINNASCTLAYNPTGGNGPLVVANNLTITAGSFNTWDGTNSADLTVTNATSVTGTLSCHASTVSLGSGSVAGIVVDIYGTFNGGAATITSGGDWAVRSGGTWTATSGNHTFNGMATNSTIDALGGSTFTAGTGTLTFTYAGHQICNFAGTGNPNNITINNASCIWHPYINTTVGGILTITTGVLSTESNVLSGTYRNLTVTGTSSITGTLTPNTSTCTFNGIVAVNSGGTLGGNTAWTCDCNADMTINSGATMSAPNGSGTFTMSGTHFDDGGTFTNNSGTAAFDGAVNCDIDYNAGATSTTVFYNFTSAKTGSTVVRFRPNSGAVIVQNTLTINALSIIHLWCYDKNQTITVGTVSVAGSVVNNGTVEFIANATHTASIQGALTSYPCVCTGTDWNWDSTASGLVAIKWLDYQIDATTGGGGCTINFTGDMTIDGWTITAGDTTTCTVQDTTITGNPAKNIDDYGTFTLTGASGHNVTLTGFDILIARGGCTQTLQYVTLTQGASAGASGWQWISGTAITHTLDHITYTHASGIGGIASTSVNTKITLTNSSISGASGGSWGNQDVVVYTGAKFQFSVCTFNYVGMQATSGWVVRKDASSNFDVYGVLGSETPDSGYRAADVTGSLAVSVADYYDTVFNSSYTLGAAMTGTTLMTINYACGFDTGGYNLTASSGCFTDGIVTCGASTVSITGTGALYGYSLFVDVDATYNGDSGAQTIGSVGFNGVFIATSATTTITSRNTSGVAWYNGGVFNSASGKVDFTGQSGTSHYDIMGDNTWYDLEISTTATNTHRFEDSKTQTIVNSVVITGAAGFVQTIKSISGGEWALNVTVTATQNFDHLDVIHSDASAGVRAIGLHSIDGGSNINWWFSDRDIVLPFARRGRG